VSVITQETTDQIKWISVDSITSFVELRKTKKYGVKLLKEKIREYGFISSFPLLVVPAGN